MSQQIETFVFLPDGAIPNHTLPLVLYPEGLAPALRNPMRVELAVRNILIRLTTLQNH